MNSLTTLEKKLATIHGRTHCKLVGNGTTAIYLALLAQNIKNQRVALPNNVCMNVLLPIYFSNNIPVFVDIERETLGLDVKLLEEEKVDTLIAVHSYGNVYDIEATREYCQKNKVFLIEDVAIAQGMQYDNRILGSFGDLSILSFGAGKMLDIGHGGAILTNDDNLFAAILSELDKLKEFDSIDAEEITLIGKEHTRLYNLDFGRSFSLYAKEFKKKVLEKQKHYLYKFNMDYIEKLDTSLDKLDNLLSMRQKNAEYLEYKFSEANLETVTLLKPKYGSAYWRFNIYVDKHRDELFSYLLSKKYKVSSWQHSVDALFEENRVVTELSQWVGDHIINLWVNEDIDKVYLDSISDDIIKFLRGKENDRG